MFETKDADSDLKIIDFGLSRILKGASHEPTLGGGGKEDKGGKKPQMERMETRAGTPNYISPEVLAGNYGVECDMWSAGCILYILLCGYPPFYGDDDMEILQMVQKGKFDFDGEEWADITKEAKDLIKKLICRPEKRLTAQEALEHKWFRKALKEDKKKKKLNFSNERMNHLMNFNKATKLQ